MGAAGPIIAALNSGEDATWRDFAACAEVGGDIWFPEKGGSTRQAKEVCASCEVRAACLDYALEHSIAHGIWGGLSETERRPLRVAWHRHQRQAAA